MLDDDRAGLLIGDCREALKAFPDDFFDSVVCDPPYGISFMGRNWDRFDGTCIDGAFLHWLAGFTDGEGCFSVHKKNVNGCETYDCQFAISLRADDYGILEEMQRTLRIGTLHTREREDANPQARWCVSSKAECAVLRDIFRAFPLRAKKARDFEIWSQALDAWINHEQGVWEDVAKLRDQLMKVREYSEKAVRIDPFQLWCSSWAREVFRVLKPGGHLVSFGGTRTYHRMASGIEDAGFEIRDMIEWLYGTGFPKSLDIAKEIDKKAGFWRGKAGALIDGNRAMSAGNYERTAKGDPITAAAAWEGWGTALKPAHEPACLARKPLIGTVRENVLELGTGGLNINGCRVGDETVGWKGGAAGGATWNESNCGLAKPGEPRPREGRWPANVCVDEAVDGLEGLGKWFYCPKPSRAEREQGCEGLPPRSGFEAVEREEGSAGVQNPRAGAGRTADAVRNFHPTVKPIDLMLWLVRLVTPPGGVVLDPFAGSGSTGVAALREGFRFVGVEFLPEHAAIAEARIRNVLRSQASNQ